MLESVWSGLSGVEKGIVRGYIGVIAAITFVSLNVLLLTWLERKVIARIHVRYGPNRAGPFGILQPIADMLKLFTKEDIVPRASDKLVYNTAPWLAFLFALLPFAAIGLASGLIASDISLGVLYIAAVSSLSTIAVLMAGWGSNNKYSLLGAMRTAAQSLSYEMPLVLSMVGVVAIVGSLSTQDIVAAQAESWLGVVPKWFIFYQPLAFIVFFTAVVAEMGRIPFDLPESESELVAGFHTEYSGMKFAMFMFAEYIHFVVGSALVVILFLGGWHLPVISGLVAGLGAVKYIVQVSIFIAKMYIVIFILMWIRGTLTRTKVNNVLSFGWKGLLPLALVNIVITGVLLSL